MIALPPIAPGASRERIRDWLADEEHARVAALLAEADLALGGGEGQEPQLAVLILGAKALPRAKPSDAAEPREQIGAGDTVKAKCNHDGLGRG